MPAPDRCPFPGCNQLVEQPPGGGPRKRFCSDQHRIQFWRQTRPKPAAEELSPVLLLRNQVEQSVAVLETLLERARTTLLELANLDEAEALRHEWMAAADEKVARALLEKSAEERRRHAAEANAQAAAQSARQATEQAEQAHAEALAFREAAEAARTAQRQAEKERDQQAKRHRQELEQMAQRHERSQERLERALEAFRVEAEARVKSLIQPTQSRRRKPDRKK